MVLALQLSLAEEVELWQLCIKNERKVFAHLPGLQGCLMANIAVMRWRLGLPADECLSNPNDNDSIKAI